MKIFLNCILTVTLASAVLFSCQKELDEEDQSQAPAKGSLWDSSGNCFLDSVHGTFYESIIPGDDTAFIEVKVDITQTGTYNINSDLHNGLKFADSGVFNKTGFATIHLKPIGKPITISSEIFTIQFGNSFCTVVVNIKDSAGISSNNNDSTSTDTTGIPNGTWQFTANGIHYAGTFDTAAFRTDAANGLPYLKLVGRTAATKDSTLQINIYFPNGLIKTDVYETQGPANSSSTFNFSNKNNNPIFYAKNDPFSSSLVAINVILYDDTSKIIEGLISGIANDANGDANVTIGGGAFEVNITQ